jgi:lysophospholipase L1-like esterase
VGGTGTLVGLAAMVASGVSAAHASRRISRLRARAATVTPLDHDIDLPGRFPPRWLTVMGDSAAAGHALGDPELAIARRVGRALVASDGRATAVRSVAADGATTADVLAHQVAAATDAEVVLLGVGVNDALRPDRPHAEVAATTHRLLTAIREVAAPEAGIVFLTCPDLSAAPGLPRLLRPVVGWRCRRIATAQAAVAAMHAVPIVEVPRSVLAPGMFGADGFHPGALGHERLAARAAALLASGGAPAQR